MASKHSFKALIQEADRGGAFIEIPFDVEKELGSKRPKVKAVIEGIPYRGTLVRMGTKCHILGLLKSIREQAGKGIGDEVSVNLELDTEERVVEIPEELRKAMGKEKQAQAFFESLSYTHKKEYVTYITEAKREETRLRRLARVVEMLKQGRKNP